MPNPSDTPTGNGGPSPKFLAEWTDALPALERYVRGQARDDHLADEVLQNTFLRACRGYANFQRRSSFKTWVLTIARNEFLRARPRRAPLLWDDQVVGEEVPATDPALPEGTMACAIAQAVAAGVLKRAQADVLLARLESEDSSWEQIAARLGLSKNHCAVLHLRALEDLRVYLFVARHYVLGGRDAIAWAFQDALARLVDPLTSAEADVFRRAVLDGLGLAAARGVLGLLRSACQKVARQLDRP